MPAMEPGAHPSRLSIAVVGLGSIGGAAAGSLAAAGRHNIVACTRRPVARFTLERAEGTVELPLRALTDPTQAKPVDWVLLCTKTHQTAGAAPWLAQLCSPATRVAVLQNGIDHVARAAPPSCRCWSIITVSVWEATACGFAMPAPMTRWWPMTRPAALSWNYSRARRCASFAVAISRHSLGASFSLMRSPIRSLR